MISKAILQGGLAAAGALAATVFATSVAQAHGGQAEQSHRDPGMKGMRELCAQDAGMQRMHQLHMQDNPGMQRMHELSLRDGLGMDGMQMHRPGG